MRDESKKFSPEQDKPKALLLNENQRSFLEAKLAQYVLRLAKTETSIRYAAPERRRDWEERYDSAAKVLAAQAVLSGEPLDQASLRHKMVETYVPKDFAEMHRDLVEAVVANALDVVKAYNDGNSDKVFHSEPV